MVHAIDTAAHLMGTHREEFMLQAVEEKMAADGNPHIQAGQVLQKLEQANNDAVALIWLLMESYERQLAENTNGEFAGPILSGMQTMAAGVRERLTNTRAEMQTVLAALKGGAK